MSCFIKIRQIFFFMELLMNTRMHALKLGRNRRLAWVSAAVLGLSASAFAQTTGTTTSPDKKTAAAGTSKTEASKNYRALRASKVIGMKVQNPQGQDLGKISDMVVNMNTGDVRYAVLEFDPGILQGEKLFAVPASQLRMAADRDTISYNMSQDKLERPARS